MSKISKKSLQTLKTFLEDHADDIAISTNDFGDLKEVYQELCQNAFDEAMFKRVAKILSNAIDPNQGMPRDRYNST